jgi:type II secretory pathway component PulF
VSDSIDADSTTAALKMLRRRGLYVTRIGAGRDLASGRARGLSVFGGHAPSRLKSLALMMRQLHAVVSCGTPLVQALAAQEQQTEKGLWRDCLADVRKRVEEGAPLSEAMEEHSEFFDLVCRSLVAAGESSGTLPTMLDRIATIVRKQLHVRNMILGAMTYPALLLGVASAVLTVLMVFVIPRFGSLFEDMGVPLPPTTQVLLALSAFVRNYWWASILPAAGLAAGLRLWMLSASGKQSFDTLVLCLPQVGRLIRSFATARIARLLGVLLSSHVPILDALHLVRQSVSNVHYKTLMANAEDAVTRGNPISEAFSQSDLVSPSVCEALRSGEQSGQVGPLLQNIADFLDEENELVMKSLTTLVEPVILLLMGLLVGAVAISLFMPLFDLTSMVQGGGS